METRNRKPIAKALAAALALALTLAGCAGPDTVPDKEVSPTPAASQETAQTQAETERITLQKAAAEELEGYRWPQESVWKTILGEEVEFTLYHGNGWTIYVPAAWEETSAGTWDAPSHCAGFSVSKQFLGVNNSKWFRAQQGAWEHKTNYDPPFDYYYDDDGGYTPPTGSADYTYFFAPDGENQSYEFTMQTIVGETSDEEKCLQEAILLSFSLDQSSHVLNTAGYAAGRTEWDAAMAGVMAETEPIWFSWYHDGTNVETDGKGNADYVSYAMALKEYDPGEFTETLFGEKPEGVETLEGDPITLCLPEMGIWLYFYNNSSWVHIYHAGEDYWTKFVHKDHPEQLMFDTVHAWLEAEEGWADSPAEISESL